MMIPKRQAVVLLSVLEYILLIKCDKIPFQNPYF
jgi:hypothetical protein